MLTALIMNQEEESDNSKSDPLGVEMLLKFYCALLNVT
jgi:hypothetical protein